MNGLTLLALIVIVVGVLAAYRMGRMHGRRDGPPLAALATTEARREAAQAPPVPPADVPAEAAMVDVPFTTEEPAAPPAAPPSRDAPADTARAAPSPHAILDAERYRLVLACEAECARLRERLAAVAAASAQLQELGEDRRRLYRELAAARGDTARYRQVVVDLENDAPPPILGERGMPDDLKLIVGIGPVLERMLQQLGIATYRQIARWTERDIDDMDARLPEFPGRIRRDAWVTQARELHQSKYGERP